MDGGTIHELQSLRKRLLSLVWVLVGLVVLSLIFVFSRRMFFSPIHIVIPFMVIMLSMLMYQHQFKRYKQKFNELVVEKTLAALFQDLHIDPNGFDQAMIEKTRMVRQGNVYHTNDQISGIYKGVSFAQADVTIQEHTSNGKTSSTTTYFSGRWLIFRPDKKPDQRLYVISRSFMYHPAYTGLFVADKLEQIKTESMAFNKQYEIWCDAGQDAFYVLTPPLMERLEQLAQQNYQVILGYIDGQLNVALNGIDDAFEPSLFRFDPEKMVEQIKKDAGVITTMIDAFSED